MTSFLLAGLLALPMQFAAPLDARASAGPSVLIDGSIATLTDARGRVLRLERVSEADGRVGTLVTLDERNFWFVYDGDSSDEVTRTGIVSWTGISDDPKGGELTGTLAAYSHRPASADVTIRWSWDDGQQVEVTIDEQTASGVFDSILPILRRTVSYCRCNSGNTPCGSLQACQQREPCPSNPMGRCLYRASALSMDVEQSGLQFKKVIISPV